MKLPASIRVAALIASTVAILTAAEHKGIVRFGGLPLPGASVTASRANQTISALADPQGNYLFPDLADGTWTLQVEMLGFGGEKREVEIGPTAAAAEWELKMLPIEQMNAQAMAPTLPVPEIAAPVKPVTNNRAALPRPGAAKPVATNTTAPFARTDVNAANPIASGSDSAPSEAFAAQDSSALAQRAADGFLINGSVNNGAASPFAQLAAFGNNRRPGRSLYSGNLGFILDNSALDARPYSLTGQDTPRPGFNRFQGLFSFGGPINIPKLIPRNGPNLTLNYQWVRNSIVTTQSALVPTPAERLGDFSNTLNAQGRPVQAIDPTTGAPFPGNTVPIARFSPQALALLKFYPLPNFDSRARYNYQVPLISGMHQDNLQVRVNRGIGRRDSVIGMFAMQSTRSDNPNIFGFLNTGDSLGQNSTLNWRHNFSPRLIMNVGVQFSRQATRITPFFANRANISGAAGIMGNNQEPDYWGPPALTFGRGITPLSDAQFSVTRNQTTGLTYEMIWSRGRHTVTYGAGFRRLQANTLAQQEPRGTFTFTGQTAGSDFAGFLLGIPDASSIAYGNADKYFRSNAGEGYINDDWRMRSGFTLNYGLRWEYGSPIAERYGRLVNLDIAPGYSAIAPVLGTNPTGTLTRSAYPASLTRPDRNNLAPRIGFAWRPFAASSMVVRGGYGIYYDTSVYQSIASQMAQQAPLSTSVRVQNSPDNPLTLANGFTASPSITPTTFAVDPGFRVGYSQNWQLSVQRDLPFALQMTATYLGNKGTRGVQQFLPNTFPAGASNPCPTCPAGYSFLTSNGNSIRQAGTLQVRRRLRAGFTAELTYTYAKAVDNAALGGRGQGGFLVAQNWLDLRAERGRSNFDQRHLISVTTQYTTGVGATSAWMTGRKGRIFKDWTVGTQVTAGTGLPLTPVYLAAVNGTGVTGSIRPDYTGLPVDAAPPGLYLNPAAYAAPASGQWGNAGRNSITGPSQFTLNASIGRSFQMNDRLIADIRVDASNALNHPVYPSWNSTVTSAQFGQPNQPNPMRSLQTTVRVRF